jgi:outer membrane immunogenic protein
MVGAITSSYAADMPVKAAPAPSIMTSAAYNWTGWYVGGNAGYGWGVGTDPGISLSDTSGTGFAAYVAAGGVPTASLQPRGGFGGGQLGYNWQAGSWVYGLEADIQGASMNASSSATVTPPAAVTGTATVEHKLRWFGTVRGRLGYAASNWLFYGTGGLIYGGVTSSLTQSATNGYFATNSTSSTRAGWTLGAGTEVGFWGKWSAKAEYLYFDLGRDSVTILGTGAFTGITYTASQKTAGHLLRAGVNYRF